jgi:hypothetical protein
VLVTYPQKLLTVAHRLIDAGEFSIAIVVAHIACEVANDRTFAEAFKAKGIEYLEEAVGEVLPGNNMGNEKTRSLYSAVTGDNIQDQPFWARFKESASRRNKISHNGTIYGKAEA